MPSPSLPDKLRLLLVCSVPSWLAVVDEAADRLGATLDIVPDVPAALARMLRPDRVYDHVLAVAPLNSRVLDALAGMLDEVTLRPTPLLLLGCATCGTANGLQCQLEPDAGAICMALTRPAKPQPADQRPLSTAELIAALHGGGLRMRFQPILDASDLRPIGLEALARIHTQARGILHPKDFIPATIACGRERVLTSVAAARTFLDIGRQVSTGNVFVSLNLPMTTVLHEQALLRGIELCAVAGVDTSRVLLEVLETRTAPDLGRLRSALEAWKQAGFRTAIDDAGPALPHWRTLLDLPFDVVKLDAALLTDPECGTLLETIVEAAKSRDRFVIAEGIEDDAALDRVRAVGVDALQGFMFSRPLPALAVPLWHRNWAVHNNLPETADMAA